MSWTRRLVSFALFAAVIALAVSTVVMVDETEYVLVDHHVRADGEGDDGGKQRKRNETPSP